MNEKIKTKLIPLPREIEITEWHRMDRKDITLVTGPDIDTHHPFAAKALSLLSPFAEKTIPAEGNTGAFEIRLTLKPETEEERKAAEKLTGLRNRDQAYMILPEFRNGNFVSLSVSALETTGLLFGAQTLSACLEKNTGSPDGTSSADVVHVPALRVLDWPAIAGRAQWGGNTAECTGWMGQWKLSEVAVYADIKGTMDPQVGLRREKREEINRNGLELVPYLRHLELMARHAGFLSNDEVTNTPDPSKPLPPEYVPGLCMSSPATEKMVQRWLEAIAETGNIPAVEIRLSEDRTPCFCENCRGKEPYVLETRLVERAFKPVKEKHPGVSLRLLLSQGSYHYNRKILETAAPETQITYYDGGRTYDSSHDPMIYPLLADYSESGNWLGVYPQITHSWRTVFPFTGAGFIHDRCREFAQKQLDNVTGYAVPTNAHHEFNVMAMAEWCWNPEGRTPEEFCRAYAAYKGIDPELFTRWAQLAGDAGWWFAESNLLLRLIYSYDLSHSLSDNKADDHRFSRSGIRYKRETIEEALEKSIKSADIARQAGVPDMRDESEALQAGLEILLSIDDLRHSEGFTGAPGRCGEILIRMDDSAARLSRAVDRWGTRVQKRLYGAEPYTDMIRHRDTANVLFRLTDHLWKTYTTVTGSPDPRKESREKQIGTWNRNDFTQELKTEYTFDITHQIEPKTPSYVCFTYKEGDFAAFIRQVSITAVTHAGEKTIHTQDEPSRIGRWARWREYKLPIPENGTLDKVFLNITLEVMYLENYKDTQWECGGSIGIRTPRF